MSDLLGAVLTIGTVLTLLVIAEGLAKLDRITKENARKLIHVGVGNVIFFIPLFETRILAAGIPAVFVFGNYLLSPMSPIEALRLRTFKAGHAWGTILYPVSLSLTTYLFFDSPWMIVAAFFPVVYGDGFAAVFGPRAKQGVFRIFNSQKSLLGTSVVGLFSWVSVMFGVLILGEPIELAILVSLMFCISSPFIELLSPKGTDNLVLPVVNSIILVALENQILNSYNFVDLQMFLIGLVFGIVFALGGYFAKVLTVDGAIVGFLLTLMMLGLGGPAIGTQLFLFFVLGSVATKVVKKIAGDTQEEFEKGGEQRDAIQAVAKAGIPAVLSVIYIFGNQLLIFYIISGIIAAALIDTMSTEIGIATRGTPVHVLSPWKRAEPGQTGVISLKGTIGGMTFGLLFTIIIFFVATTQSTLNSVDFLKFNITIVLAGTLGMLTDSILGTTIQRHFKCLECEKVVEATEHHGKATVLAKGVSWFNNDMTNVFGSLSGGIYAFLILQLWI